MRYHALRLLHAGYVPLTLEELDDSTIRKNEASLSGALSIIPVARQCNALWLLPSAFYLACALDKGKWHEFEELQDAALDITEERLILRRRARLMYINNLLVCQPLRKLCENEHEYCEQAKLILLSTWTDAPPLRDVEDLSDTNLCSLCLPRVDLGVEIGRSSVWDLLPAMFNLPSWEELKKQQAIDLGYSTNSSMVAPNWKRNARYCPHITRSLCNLNLDVHLAFITPIALALSPRPYTTIKPMNVDNLTQSPRLWFPGGTVIFRAEDTIYRVCPDILSSCSPIFRSMFGIPQPSSQENYEGVPLICMADSERNLTALFEAVYTPQYSQWLIFTSPTRIFMPHDQAFQEGDHLFDMLAILKLSTKYQIEHLRFHSLRLLRAEYVPFTLAELMEPERRMATAAEALQIIPVARQCSALWLLPSLFYVACELGKSSQWHALDLDYLEKAGLSITEERRILRGRSQLT
ncbi:hypothetical protein BDV98DRAFT_585142 [Pterulicium gracile]|uniref:BTB domain-containing protein n=1 Tax=Pterulicium gracile TaxID=1884261 RepID=A0A5C3Q8C7_9AGAR|nr:hypothetical protein BDV98DRAFT_585142 [Pterula gracilis]